jgi:hypothetical protein
MSKYMTVLIIGMVLILSAPLVAYDVNKDIHNRKNPSAYDVAVILKGTETVTAHFDGYTAGTKRGRFGTFTWGPDGANTKLHWQSFTDGDNNAIDSCQTIHIGWSTGDHNSEILDMYWTDIAGQRIPGSSLYNITTNWTYASLDLYLQWHNVFTPDGGSGDTIKVITVYYAELDNAIPLDSLNTENPTLASQLQLIGDDTVAIAAGGGYSLRIPGVAENKYIVVRYKVDSRLSGADFTDFVQFGPTPDTVPTLSEWGLIIFSLLILTLVTVVVARRKMATAGGGADVSVSGPLFIPHLFRKTLTGTMGLAVVIVVAAMAISGSIPARDIVGTIISAVIVAYMAHLWLYSAKKE